VSLLLIVVFVILLAAEHLPTPAANGPRDKRPKP